MPVAADVARHGLQSGYNLLKMNLAVAVLLLASQKTPIPEDKSFAIDEYIKAGVPAPDREWAPDDYVRATKALKEVCGKDALRLPRHGSKTSGALFARACSTVNLDLLKNKNIPVGHRVKLTADLQLGLRDLLILYVEPAVNGLSFDRELIEIMGFMLATLPLQFTLVEEFMAALPKDDPNRDARLKGLERMREGAATSVNGALTTLDRSQDYRTGDVLRFIELLKGSLPSTIPHLPAQTQKEVPVRLKALADKEADRDLRKALGELLKLCAPDK